jgi:Flp pilus assembly pilin Flp
MVTTHRARDGDLKPDFEAGAGMVEYTLLVAFVGLLLIGVIALLTNSLDATFSDAGNAFP